MLPITLLGTEEPVSLAYKHLQTYICHLVQSNFELSLAGKLDFLDGIVFPGICDSVTCISDIWRRHHPYPFHHNIVVPERMDSLSSKHYLMEEFTGLKTHLEEFSSNKISVRSLRESIAIYNGDRALLSRLYQLRRADPSLFRARDVATIVMASMLMPKEEHIELLSQLLKCAPQAGQQANSKVKIVVSGYLCEGPELEVLDLIEGVGGVIADDDLYVGTRYFSTLVDEMLPPLEALVERYIKDVPCPTKYNPARDWADYLLSIVRRSEAKGVIIMMMKYCEPPGFDYPYLKARLTAKGIPHLFLEIEPPLSLERIKTRLQAFMEILRR